MLLENTASLQEQPVLVRKLKRAGEGAGRAAHPSSSQQRRLTAGGTPAAGLGEPLRAKGRPDPAHSLCPSPLLHGARSEKKICSKSNA